MNFFEDSVFYSENGEKGIRWPIICKFLTFSDIPGSLILKRKSIYGVHKYYLKYLYCMIILWSIVFQQSMTSNTNRCLLKHRFKLWSLKAAKFSVEMSLEVWMDELFSGIKIPASELNIRYPLVLSYQRDFWQDIGPCHFLDTLPFHLSHGFQPITQTLWLHLPLVTTTFV